MKEDFEIIWNRLIENQGKDFYTIKKVKFTYTIGNDNSFNPSVPEIFPKASIISFLLASKRESLRP